VSKVAAGGVYVSLAMAERLAQSLNEPADDLPHRRLSDREFEVFRRIAAGETITQIAQALSVSAKTVSTYKTRILEKNADAARHCIGPLCHAPQALRRRLRRLTASIRVQKACSPTPTTLPKALLQVWPLADFILR
jgi:DNA-binding CsgD family transcriptional regulator